MAEFHERERERFVDAFGAEGDLPRAAAVVEALRGDEPGGEQERARRGVGGDELDVGGGQVGLVGLVGHGLRGGDDLEAEAGGGEGGRRGGTAHLEEGVRVVGLGHDAEGQLRVLDGGVALQQRIGDGDDVVERCVGDVGEGDLVVPVAFGVIFRVALVEPQVEIFLPEAAEQFADEEENEAEVGEENPGFAPGELEPRDVRGEEVEQEQTADEVAAREDRQGDAADLLPDDERAEPFLLDAPDAEVRLVEGGGEDQEHPEHEQGDRELEGDEEIAEVAEQGLHGVTGFTVLRKSRNAGLAWATSASGPVSLKNHIASW